MESWEPISILNSHFSNLEVRNEEQELRIEELEVQSENCKSNIFEKWERRSEKWVFLLKMDNQLSD